MSAFHNFVGGGGSYCGMRRLPTVEVLTIDSYHCVWHRKTCIAYV